MTAVATLVAMLAAGLLLHLCIFHVYINLHDITTYEYVRAQRQAQEEQQREALAAAANNENGDNEDEERSGCSCGVMARDNKVAPDQVDTTT